MKKILLSIIISVASVCAFAQPTMDFDTPSPGWTGSGANIEPIGGWISANALTGFGDPQSVFQATAPNVHGGTYAMQITSVALALNPAPTSLPSPIGLAATGGLVGTTLKFGFPFSVRPTSISFWYKYTPVTNDTAACFMVLWNGIDTVGTGFWKTGATVGSYTQQTVTLNYNPAYASVTPDSAALIFSSTRLFNSNYKFCLNCGQAGSILWVDDINIPGWSGMNEIEMSKGVSVFPNPAHDLATITLDNVSEAATVEVFDITGRLISTIPFSEAANVVDKKSAIIPTRGMSAGFYSLSVYDKSKHLLRSGKLNVVK
jgi:hypothetical protein